MTYRQCPHWLHHPPGPHSCDGCWCEGEPWKAHRATGLGKVKFFTEGETPVIDKEPHTAGRWPANVLLDQHAAAWVDEQSGEASYNPAKTFGKSSGGSVYGNGAGIPSGADVFGYGDRGGASRFSTRRRPRSLSVRT